MLMARRVVLFLNFFEKKEGNRMIIAGSIFGILVIFAIILISASARLSSLKDKEAQEKLLLYVTTGA